MSDTTLVIIVGQLVVRRRARATSTLAPNAARVLEESSEVGAALSVCGLSAAIVRESGRASHGQVLGIARVARGRLCDSIWTEFN
eukprot:10126603-Lingulodinium_polyedra.AAC.1